MPALCLYLHIPACCLQRKLTNLEDSHAALTSAHKQQQADLDASRTEAARLQREAGQLGTALEKLEARWACLLGQQGQKRSAAAVERGIRRVCKLCSGHLLGVMLWRLPGWCFAASAQMHRP